MAQNEGGINQTLYNLFNFIAPEDFLGITEVDQQLLKKLSVAPFTSRYLSFAFDRISLPDHKPLSLIKPIIAFINQLLPENGSFKYIKEAITNFKPDALVICANSSAGILAFDRVFKNDKVNYPVIPYFMDDWMSKISQDQLGLEVDHLVKQLLTDNNYWMMISKELTEILSDRYQAQPKQLLAIRNPVDLADAPEPDQPTNNAEFTIAYAGALWPMHFDAFRSVAKAIKNDERLQQVQLKLYTQESQWNWRKAELMPLNVVYGGHLPYKQIHQQLNSADALLITASFNKENYTHTTASLQTKITDYSKARRPIVSCAPDYSANNRFLKDNDCGFCIETNNETEIANKLVEFINNISNYQYLASNAFDTLKDYTQDVAHKKIQSFIQSAINNLNAKSTNQSSPTL